MSLRCPGEEENLHSTCQVLPCPVRVESSVLLRATVASFFASRRIRQAEVACLQLQDAILSILGSAEHRPQLHRG